MRFDTALATFVDALTIAKRSPHTVAAYRRDLTIVARDLTDVTGVDPLTVEAIDVPSLRRALARRAVDASPATMSRTHSSWTAFFGFLRSERLVDANPMDEIERARVGTDAIRSIDVDDLAGRLLRAAAGSGARSAWPVRDVAIVGTLSQTGVRLAELVGLDLGSVTGEPGARQVTVVGKGRKARTMPITGGLERLLETYLTERFDRFEGSRERRMPLFVHPTSGERVTARQVQYLVERLYREAGIRGDVPDGALVHALRHSFAMDLLDHGADVVELQTLLGHASLNTTRRYLTARPDRLRDAIATSAAAAAIDREAEAG
jgi:integrase/recombinase XerD